MDFGLNDIEVSMAKTKESVESQDDVLAVISDFHNYGSRQTKNGSKTLLLNNASVRNNDVPSNENNIDLSNSIIFKIGEYYICPECKDTFLYLRNLKRHVKNKHTHLMTFLFPSGDYKCNICGKSLKSLKSVQNHKRACHRVHKCRNRSECAELCKFHKKHKCPLCPEALKITQFNEHFEKNHNLLLTPVKLKFDSYEKFCEWKKSIERVTKSYFLKQSSRVKNGIGRHTFVCHRSGTFKSEASKNKRKLKAQGSRKINALCPAVMKVTEMKDKKCEVLFQSHHLGHKNELKHLNLTYEERIYVAEKLAANISLNDILHDIKNSASQEGAERLCLLTRKDLNNIKASLLKDRQSYLSAAKLDEKLTKDLKDIHDKHAESNDIKANITKIEKGWLLTFIENNEIYLIKEKSQSCDCPLVCVYCRACIKSYACNCTDSYIDENMCKHIHFFCMERNKILGAPKNNDNLDCDNSMSEVTSNSEQFDALTPSSSTLDFNEISEKDKKNFIDSEKKCVLKNELSDLIDNITTEEELRLVGNTTENLTVKLEPINNQSQDKSNDVIISTIHHFETVFVTEDNKDQNATHLISSHPLEIEHINKNNQEQDNSVLAGNNLFQIPYFNDDKQNQFNSDSQSTGHRPLILKMLKPTEGAHVCYIHFAKAKNN